MRLDSKKVPVATALPIAWLEELERRAQQERKTVCALIRDWVGDRLWNSSNVDVEQKQNNEVGHE